MSILLILVVGLIALVLLVYVVSVLVRSLVHPVQINRLLPEPPLNENVVWTLVLLPIAPFWYWWLCAKLNRCLLEQPGMVAQLAVPLSGLLGWAMGMLVLGYIFLFFALSGAVTSSILVMLGVLCLACFLLLQGVYVFKLRAIILMTTSKGRRPSPHLTPRSPGRETM